MAQAITAQPCICCGASLAGYYCRAQRGTAKYVGFVPYQDADQYKGHVYYRRGTPSGRLSVDWFGDEYFIESGDDAEFTNCGAFTAGTMSVYDGSSKNGYSCISEAGKYLPGNLNNSACTGSLATSIGAAGRSTVSLTSVKWTQIVDPFNTPHTSGPLFGTLSQKFTADNAFTWAVCNGYDPAEEYEECRAYLTSENTDFSSGGFQEFEGQSMVVFFTIVNGVEGDGMTLTAEFILATLQGDIVNADVVTLNFTAPATTFLIKYDVPMPAEGYQYYLNTVTFSTGGPGGSVTYDGDEGAYTIVEGGD